MHSFVQKPYIACIGCCPNTSFEAHAAAHALLYVRIINPCRHRAASGGQSLFETQAAIEQNFLYLQPSAHWPKVYGPQDRNVDDFWRGSAVAGTTVLDANYCDTVTFISRVSYCSRWSSPVSSRGIGLECPYSAEMEDGPMARIRIGRSKKVTLQTT